MPGFAGHSNSEKFLRDDEGVLKRIGERLPGRVDDVR